MHFRVTYYNGQPNIVDTDPQEWVVNHVDDGAPTEEQVIEALDIDYQPDRGDHIHIEDCPVIKIGDGPDEGRFTGLSRAQLIAELTTI